MHPQKIAATFVLVPILALLAACGGNESKDATASSTTADPATAQLPQGSEPSGIDPAEFTTEIDNPYLPLKPGSRWLYTETEAGEPDQKVVVEVTDETKAIENGVEAVVVRDTVTAGGEPIEVTDDWYAQDSEGNVWYLGEDTAEYENGKVVSRSGSFEAGVDGADAGIVMPAHPAVGMRIPPGVLRGRSRGRGGGPEPRGEGSGSGRLLPVDSHDEGPRAAGAEGLRAQVLCRRGGTGARDRHVGRRGP